MNHADKIFGGKKVLVFGLGLLGGGVSAANWLLKHGARACVTDLKTKKQLAPSLKKIKGRAVFSLGGHKLQDIRKSDIMVVNPDVSFRNQFVEAAQRYKVQLENEATIFYRLWPKKLVGVTGTRGKTTVANWINHFLNKQMRSVVTGNSYSTPLLSVLDNSGKHDIAVTELSSFLLEFFALPWKARAKPHVAVITNIYQDHLNRYHSLSDYAKAKSNLFQYQTDRDYLVLNRDNAWTPFMLRQKPKGRVWLFSNKSALHIGKNGVWHKKGAIYFRKGDIMEKALSIGNFAAEYGEHNLENLLASSLSAHLAGVQWRDIQKRIKTLPSIPFRQEIIFKNKRLLVVNDTTATSPEGALAALKRFGSSSCVLIAGGTDKKLDFKQWGKEAPKYIKAENMVLLSGSATKKMLAALPKKYKGKIAVYETLTECWRAALQRTKTGKITKSVVVFSPGAKSFEKFKNEFDRGKQFTAMVRKEIRK
jgi:UDP-N-acetylmuramoylalanine--D-glutamate ligase